MLRSLVGSEMCIRDRYREAETTLPALIDSEGNWGIREVGSFKFGDNTSLFIAGSDLDGDGKTDLAFSSNACQSGRSDFHFRLNPLSDNATEDSFRAKRGNYYKFYMDSDGDNVDELCTLLPLRVNREITRKFRAICKSALTKKRINSIRTGIVNGQPLPIKIAGQADLLLIPRQNNTNTCLLYTSPSPRDS